MTVTLARRQRAGVVAQYALLAGPLLSMLDSSIFSVAAEPVARALHASLGIVQWTVSGYLLALGTGLAGTAYLARRYGTLPVYRASLAGFTIASALCALSPAAAALIAFRAVQGLVAAPLVPLAMSMLLGKSGGARSLSPAAGILLFAAPALGPTVGGALIGAGGWRLIFAVNLPFGLLAWLAARRLPAGVSTVRSEERTEFDCYGLAMLAAGVTFVLLGTSQGGTDGWGAAPQGVITGLSTALGPRVLSRFTVRATVCAGFFVLGAGSLLLLTVGAGTPLWLISLILAVRSVSIGLVITPLLTVLTGPLPPERMGDASTLFNVVQRMAGSFGIGLLASLYAVQARSGGGPAGALHVTGAVIACIAGFGAVGAMLLPAVRNTSVMTG